MFNGRACKPQMALDDFSLNLTKMILGPLIGLTPYVQPLLALQHTTAALIYNGLAAPAPDKLDGGHPWRIEVCAIW